MCWQSETVKKTTIAEKDIQVFKIVKLLYNFDGNNIPSYKVVPACYPLITYGYYYPEENRFEINQKGYFKEGPIEIHKIVQVDSEFEERYFRLYQCYNAFHSYKSDMVTATLTDNYDVKISQPSFDYYYYYYQGSENNYIVMECVIPKGANYAVNEEGECVSDEIKVLRFKELKNVLAE